MRTKDTIFSATLVFIGIKTAGKDVQSSQNLISNMTWLSPFLKEGREEKSGYEACLRCGPYHWASNMCVLRRNRDNNICGCGSHLTYCSSNLLRHSHPGTKDPIETHP